MSVRLDPRIGTELAGYRIERVLGRGGMGVVYLAEDLRLKRKVALKLIAPELAADERFRERFLRESEFAASLDHSNVVPIYEAGETEGRLYIAMRYVEGTDLKTLLAGEAPLEPRQALVLVGQVAEALDVAHEHGLVHRDVKPANVLIASEGGREHVYLADFGLSKQTSSERTAPPITLKGAQAYRDSLSDELQKVLRKEHTPERAAKALQDRWDKITEERSVETQVEALKTFA